MGIIKICNASKLYGRGNARVKALDNVSLDVEKGDLIAITGVSGSGKTTLLNIIGLIEEVDSGSIYLNGEDISTLNSKQKARLRNRKIGFVLQSFGLLEDETVISNVSLPLVLAGMRRAERVKKSMSILERFCISSLANKKCSQLSGGEKQRVAIARALVTDPDIILADEPTGALDTKTTNLVMEEFIAINGMGKTVVVVTHDPMVASKCRTHICLRDGKVVDE